MNLKKWEWRFNQKTSRIEAVHDLRLPFGRTIALKVESPEDFESTPPAMVEFMCNHIKGMNELSIRRQLKEGGIPPEWLSGFTLGD